MDHYTYSLSQEKVIDYYSELALNLSMEPINFSIIICFINVYII